MKNQDKLELILMDRVISSFPISISTASVLEAIFDPIIDPYDIENVPTRIDIDKYKYHYFNIYTLVRNIVESLSTKDRDVVLMGDIDDILYRILQRECNEITMLYENLRCVPVVYFPKYHLYDDLPSLKFIKLKSKTSIKNYKIEQAVKYIRNKNLLTGIDKLHLSTNQLINTGSSLITTHYPVDLIHIADSCDLLESHTGKLKDKHDRNTKYTKLKGFDNSILPFNKTLLYMLGDRGTMITGVGVSTKREVCRKAFEKKWYVYTTETEIKYDIRHILKQLKGEDRKWIKYL